MKVIQKISRKLDRANASTGVWLVLGTLVSFVLLPFALLFGLRERTGDVIVVRMPQCSSCAGEGKPDPIRVNAEQLSMTFVVHHEFKKQNAGRPDHDTK